MKHIIPPSGPETDAAARIQSLKSTTTKMEGEIRTLEGKLANRDTEKIKAIQKDNEALKIRHADLEKALLILIVEAFKFQHTDDAETKYETLRLAALDYCKHSTVPPELWKSIDY